MKLTRRYRRTDSLEGNSAEKIVRRSDQIPEARAGQTETEVTYADCSLWGEVEATRTRAQQHRDETAETAEVLRTERT